MTPHQGIAGGQARELSDAPSPACRGLRRAVVSLRYSLGLAANGMWFCELGFSLAGLLVGVHLMGAGCVMGNGLGVVVRVNGDRPLVRHLSRRADACGGAAGVLRRVMRASTGPSA